MKVFIEVGDEYILLEDDLEVSNFKNDLIKDEVMSNAMDKIEDYKLRMEIKRHKNNPVMMMKLGEYPNMKESA